MLSELQHLTQLSSNHRANIMLKVNKENRCNLTDTPPLQLHSLNEET